MEETKAIIEDLQDLKRPLRKPVLTIGNFDGVHRGHLALFERVKQQARAIGGQSAVMTFNPHPLKVMAPQKSPQLITPTPQKLQLIRKAGIDVIICLPFNREFAAISARDFVQEILIRRIGVRELVVGYDYSFGHKREGNIDLLERLGREFGFLVHVVEPVRIDDLLVSSTSIRERVQDGDLAGARTLLGRDYQVCGTVIRGKNRGGRLLGFPTANLRLMDELLPKQGVYAVRVLLNGRVLNGVTNIGFNPTFGDGALSVETHILDFDEDLLGRTIRLDFVQRLRDEMTYGSVEELAAQIHRDAEDARRVLE